MSALRRGDSHNKSQYLLTSALPTTVVIYRSRTQHPLEHETISCLLLPDTAFVSAGIDRVLFEISIRIISPRMRATQY